MNTRTSILSTRLKLSEWFLAYPYPSCSILISILLYLWWNKVVKILKNIKHFHNSSIYKKCHISPLYCNIHSTFSSTLFSYICILFSPRLARLLEWILSRSEVFITRKLLGCELERQLLLADGLSSVMSYRSLHNYSFGYRIFVDGSINSTF